MAKIEWNKVTWYSKLAALILALIILCVGIYLGMALQAYRDTNAAIATTSTH